MKPDLLAMASLEDLEEDTVPELPPKHPPAQPVREPQRSSFSALLSAFERPVAPQTPHDSGASSGGLPPALWSRVFVEVGTQHPATLRRLPLVCRTFRDACADPPVRAALLLAVHGRHLAFHQALLTAPHSLTFELAEALVREGALLPRFLVEQAHRRAVAGSLPLPAGTAEYLVAQAYRQYGDRLLIGGVDTMGVADEDEDDGGQGDAAAAAAAPHLPARRWLDDHAELTIALARDPIDLARTEVVVREHHYTPALNDALLASSFDLDVLWDGIARLALLDAETAMHLVRHSGVPFVTANDAVAVRILASMLWTPDALRAALAAGFSISHDVAVALLSDPRIATPTFGRVRSLMADLFPRDRLLSFIEDAMYELCRQNTRPAMRVIDFLLNEYEVPERTAGRALLAHPYDIRQMRMKRRYLLPLATTFGVAHGGMSDAFWPVVATKFGLGHVFVESCLIDMLVGGAIPTTLSPETNAMLFVDNGSSQGQSRGGVSAVAAGSAEAPITAGGLIAPPAVTKSGINRQRASVGQPSRMLFSWMSRQRPPDLDADAESSSRDSLAAMFDLGVPIRPTETFPVIAHMVYSSRKVPLRVLEYMSRVERGVLKSAPPKPNSPRDDNAFPAAEWLRVFRQCVLEEPNWVAVIPSDTVTASTPLDEADNVFLTSGADDIGSVLSAFGLGHSNGNGSGDSPISVASGAASLMSNRTTGTSSTSHYPASIVSGQTSTTNMSSIFGTSTKGFFHSFTETVRLMDPRDSQWKQLRRFHAAVRELALVLDEQVHLTQMRRASTDGLVDPHAIEEFLRLRRRRNGRRSRHGHRRNDSAAPLDDDTEFTNADDDYDEAEFGLLSGARRRKSSAAQVPFEPMDSDEEEEEFERLKSGVYLDGQQQSDEDGPAAEAEADAVAANGTLAAERLLDELEAFDPASEDTEPPTQPLTLEEVADAVADAAIMAAVGEIAAEARAARTPEPAAELDAKPSDTEEAVDSAADLESPSVKSPSEAGIAQAAEGIDGPAPASVMHRAADAEMSEAEMSEAMTPRPLEAQVQRANSLVPPIEAGAADDAASDASGHTVHGADAALPAQEAAQADAAPPMPPPKTPPRLKKQVSMAPLPEPLSPEPLSRPPLPPKDFGRPLLQIETTDMPRRRRLVSVGGPFQQWLHEAEAATEAAAAAAGGPARAKSLTPPSESPQVTFEEMLKGSPMRSDKPAAPANTVAASALSAVNTTTSWVRSWFSH
ncbi:hypothetical protein HK105_204193 [Polyrhizophydium stewartii]|uniref:F-box domain-containing protein n=1 Tax=Polyrhizophydium stewartii TaxID=2732419 RepID=A0ABR4N985_9FUNG